MHQLAVIFKLLKCWDFRIRDFYAIMMLIQHKCEVRKCYMYYKGNVTCIIKEVDLIKIVMYNHFI